MPRKIYDPKVKAALLVADRDAIKSANSILLQFASRARMLQMSIRRGVAQLG